MSQPNPQAELAEQYQEFKDEVKQQLLDSLPKGYSPELTENIINDSRMDGYNQCLQEIKERIKKI